MTATTPTRKGRLLALLSALAMALALLALPPAATPASAQEDGVTPARVSGPEGTARYETAAAIAAATFERADDAVIVTGEDFPDALAASFAAGAERAPILLVGQDQIPAATWDVMDDLGVGRVFIVGGPAAISDDVESEFDEAGMFVHRVSGETRFETAVNVAYMFAELGVGEVAGDRTALLASGEAESFADALSAGPLAAQASLPLLLTPSDRPIDPVDEALDELQIERVIVVGGPSAVSSDVVEHYQALGYEVERFRGPTRTGTAVTVAQNAIQRFPGFTPDLILLARGDDYPDALAASIHGAVTGSPILLTADPDVLSPSTHDYLVDLCPEVNAIRALGGTAAVSEQALRDAVNAADACRDDGGAPDDGGDPNQTYGVAPQEIIEADPGHEQEFSLFGEDADTAAELALFPCESATLVGSQVHFDDADGDGFADGSGETDTGYAEIASINGEAQTAGQTRDRAVTGEGYTVTVGSAHPDCAFLVFFEAGPHGMELPVDADGAPRVRFGVGVISWTE